MHAGGPDVERPVRVAVAALNFVPGGMGGTETYAVNLTRELVAMDEIDVSTFVPGNARGYLAGDEHAISHVRAGVSTAARLGAIAATSMRSRRIRAIMRGSDVVHFPFTSFLPVPPPGIPVVTTLHDVQHLDLPELFNASDFAYRERFYHRGARAASIVITISEFARRAITSKLDVDPARVRVIPLGVDHARFRPSFAERAPFVLYPARGWRHKNHAALVSAMKIVRRTRPELKLVLTGGGLDGLGELPAWVDRRGLVSESELTELYRDASALIYPSLYEGFGLPPLEAMASGCPVAASSSGSVPEVCGDAAVLFDATEPSSIAEGVLTVLEHSDEFVQKGIARARSFTWRRCAELHVDAYSSALA